MRNYCPPAIAIALMLLAGCRTRPNNAGMQAQLLVGEWRLIDSRVIKTGQIERGPGLKSGTQRFTSDGTLIWSPSSQSPYRVERRDDGDWIVTEVTTGHLQFYATSRFRIINDVLFTYEYGHKGGIAEDVFVRVPE